jgi:hypothetical protein
MLPLSHSSNSQSHTGLSLSSKSEPPFVLNYDIGLDERFRGIYIDEEKKSETSEVCLTEENTPILPSLHGRKDEHNLTSNQKIDIDGVIYQMLRWVSKSKKASDRFRVWNLVDPTSTHAMSYLQNLAEEGNFQTDTLDWQKWLVKRLLRDTQSDNEITRLNANAVLSNLANGTTHYPLASIDSFREKIVSQLRRWGIEVEVDQQ